MNTLYLNPKEIPRKWYLIDAADQSPGRVAARVATVLRGKHRAYYTPHQETGDRVVVVNAAQVKLTGAKATDKAYFRHSGYPGGLKSESLEKLLARRPTAPMEHAVRGMLPKGRLGRKIFNNVKVYAGAEHPHAAQQPETMTI